MKGSRQVKSTTDGTTCPECGSKRVRLVNLGKLRDVWQMECDECHLFSFYRDERLARFDAELQAIKDRHKAIRKQLE